jgi:biofilm PGA synthesis N-glycosyltransferase PgaC
MFIWWNLLFLPLDATYTFIFIPGVIAAIFFQLYWVAGLMTLAVIPIAILWNTIIFRAQARMFREQGLKVRHNPRGLIFYLICYALMMQPMCVWGYAVESLGLRKKWGTKWPRFSSPPRSPRRARPSVQIFIIRTMRRTPRS